MTGLGQQVGAVGRYLAAAVLVRFADEGARVALVLLALERTGSAGTGGLLIAALLVPQVVAAPVVGLLTDRARRPAGVLAVAVVGFGLSLAGTAAGLSRWPLALSVVVLLVGGCCGPALTGGLTSRLPQLVRPAALPRAFGLDSMSYNIAGIAGPAVAATIAGATSARTATTVLAGCAGVGALLVATLPLRVGEPAHTRLPLTAGLSIVVRRPVLGVVTAASSLAQLGLGALAVVAAVLTQRQQHPAATGWLLTGVAAGALVGSLLWTWRPWPARQAPVVVMVSLLGVGLPLAAAAAVAPLAGVAALFGLSGLFVGPLTGAVFTVRQDEAPEALRASVFTIGAGMKLSCAAAGSALAGVGAGLPTSALLLLVGGVPVLAGGLGLLAVGRLTRRPAPVREPEAAASAPSA
ncbi:MFS transporter [uncultured Friedmanniella sp.]|uniref:MFS transporter n=1 Tax=uncultured Friedmanniella sp. TaxID=335381 RepID=UPI0035CC3640